jgi:hypothetical protein
LPRLLQVSVDLSTTKTRGKRRAHGRAALYSSAMGAVTARRPRRRRRGQAHVGIRAVRHRAVRTGSPCRRAVGVVDGRAGILHRCRRWRGGQGYRCSRRWRGSLGGCPTICKYSSDRIVLGLCHPQPISGRSSPGRTRLCRSSSTTRRRCRKGSSMADRPPCSSTPAASTTPTLVSCNGVSGRPQPKNRDCPNAVGARCVVTEAVVCTLS